MCTINTIARRAPGEMRTASDGALKQPTSVTAVADACERSTRDRACIWCSRARAATVLAALYPFWCRRFPDSFLLSMEEHQDGGSALD